MLEVIPVLTLWLCMPLDHTPPDMPVRYEDLAYFPAHHVLDAERAAARKRYDYAYARAQFSRSHGLPDADWWWRLSREAYHAWDTVDDVWRCSARLPHHSGSPVGWLADARRKLGLANFMAGLLPAPVVLEEMPEKVEVVPLPGGG